MQSFLLRSGHIVLPDEVVAGVVHVEYDRIAGVYREGEARPELPVEDVGGAWIFPGLVDTHVHINEPGRTEWEGFVTATRAAAAGGVTTLIDMPLNSDPVTITVKALAAKRAATTGKLAVDVGFHAGLIAGQSSELEALLDEGVCGVKAFMVFSGIAEFPAVVQADLEAAMPLLARRGVPLLVHAELEDDVKLPPGPGTSYARYLASRPSRWEVEAIRLLIALCERTGCPVHVVHLATADALELLTSARARGLPVSVETCPHYLHFCAEEIPDGATPFKCAPPIRGRHHRALLWDALDRGDVDLVASDHSPCPPALKDVSGGDFTKAWGGIASLQFGLPVMLTECRRRDLDPARVAEWMSAAPARLAGLSGCKGAIRSGLDADLVVVNMDKTLQVTPDLIRHRHKLTPYIDETLYGVVQKTYLRGRVVYDVHQEGPSFRGRMLCRG